MIDKTIDRSVELGGVYNVRDLGGMVTQDGRMLRKGMLFRASSLHRLTDEQAWSEFGATTVFDLRYGSELDAFPLPAFIDSPIHAPILPQQWYRARGEISADPNEHLADVYNVMLDLGATTMRDIVELLAQGEAFPAVFFCMAGKDRTGFVAAVLLSLLGVSDEDIADDFALSGDEVVALVRWLRTREDFENHPMMNQKDDLLRAPRGAMELFLARTYLEHGGLHEWVLTLDVPNESIDSLRSQLLH
jgi:protein-tyrosine phosphatase